MPPKMKRLAPILPLLILVLLTTSIALGATLPLDDRFGGFSVDGKHTVDLPSDAILHSQFPWPTVESADGYLLVAVMRNQDFELVRYHPDGRRDESFESEAADFDGQRDAPYAITLQDDGKIIVGGVADVGGNRDFALARYHPDGRLDHSFDNDGKVTTGFGLGGLNDEGINAVAIDHKGRIVAAGYAFDTDSPLDAGDNDFAVARYLANGALDTSFSGNGKWHLGFDGSDEAAQILFPNDINDHRILIAGYSNPLDSNAYNHFPVVVRLKENSDLDSTFSGNGKLQIKDRLGHYSQNSKFALQSDDMLVVSTRDNMIRYSKDGARDFSFGNGGQVFGYFEEILTDKQGIIAVEKRTGGRLWRIDHGGNLVVRGFGGPYTEFPNSNFHALRSGHFLVTDADMSEGKLVLTRFLPDGLLDDGGHVVTGFGYGNDRGFDIVQHRGGYLVAADVQSPLVSNGRDVALVRYKIDGKLDRTFVDNGRSAAELINNDFARDMVVLSDGKIVVAGYRFHTINNDFALWRFKANGKPDSSFGGSGFAVTGFGIGADYGQAVVAQPDDKVVIAGFSENNSGRYLTMARFDADGNLDKSFAQNGKFVEFQNNIFFSLRDLTILPDGDLLAVGGINDGANGNFWAYRFTADGEPVNDFGVNGFMQYDLPNYDEAFAVDVLATGRIVMAGYSNNDFGMLILEDDGRMCTDACRRSAIDPRTRLDFGGNELAYDVQVQSNGRIVMAGAERGTTPEESDFLLARLRWNPTNGFIPDEDFGDFGKLRTSMAPSSVARALLIHDERIVVAGYLQNGNDKDIALARFINDYYEPSVFSKIFLPAQEFNPAGVWWAGIQAQNLGLAAATISYTGASKNGDTVPCGERFTDIGRSANFLTDGDCPDPHARFSAGYVSTNQPTVAISSLANIGSEIAGGQYRGIDATDADKSLFFPLVKHDHVGRTTAFSVQNANSKTTDITATFAVNGQTYSKRYADVPKWASVLILPSDAGVPAGDGQVGSLIVTGSRRLAGVSLESEHNVLSTQNLQTTTAFSPADRDRILYCPLFRNAHAAKSQTSGVQVQNVADSAQTVTLTYTPVGGGPQVIRSQRIQPDASATFFAPAIGIPAGSVGSVVLNGEDNIVAVVNENGTEADGRRIMTTYSCFPADSTTGEISLPLYKEFYLGNTTGIQVQNVSGDGSAAVVQAVYKATTGGGQATFSHSTPVPDGGSITFYGVSSLSSPADIVVVNGKPQSLAGTYGSVVITADKPIVAIANEVNQGTKKQDAKNYEGFNR